MKEAKAFRLKDILIRSKIPVLIEDGKLYKRVTIKTKHQGVYLRDIKKGDEIGTKKQFRLTKGQFVLSKIDARFGAFGIAGDDVDNSIITGNFWAYDINAELVHVEWINKFTKSPEFYGICYRASSGITNRKYLNEETFLNQEILLPDILSQITILEKHKNHEYKFEHIRLEANLQNRYLTQLRQSILQEAIEGKLTAEWRKNNPVIKGDPDYDAAALLEKIKEEKERLIKEGKIKREKPLPPIKPEEIPFPLPEGWVWTRLGEVCVIQKGNVGISNAEPGKYPLVALSETRLSHNEFGFDTEAVIIPLVSSTGHGHASMKRIHFQKGKFSVGSILCCVHPLVKDSVSMQFVYLFLDLNKETLFVRKMTGMANVSLNINTIAQTIIPFPPITNQMLIADCIDLVDNLKSEYANSKSLLDKFTLTLMLIQGAKNDQKD